MFIIIMGECPCDAPGTAACDVHEQIDVLYWVFGLPIAAVLFVWVVHLLSRTNS